MKKGENKIYKLKVKKGKTKLLVKPAKMFWMFFRYNSGGKSFSQVASTKHISVSIDAVSLQNTVWKRTQPPAKGNKY